MLSGKWGPFCLGLNVLMEVDIRGLEWYIFVIKCDQYGVFDFQQKFSLLYD